MRIIFTSFGILMIAGSLAFGESPPVNAGTDSSVALTQPEQRQILTVALIADRTGGTEVDISILAEAVDEVNRLNPDFVVHIGDMVNGYTYDPDIWLAQMREVKDVLGPLRAPFYPVAGNHDTFPGSGDPRDRSNEDLYKEHFGPLYYSFDYGNSHFVCLYSDEGLTSSPYYSDEQIAWLERDLAGTDRTNIFVFSHKPTWEYGGDTWKPIHDILKEYPVRAVFGGHFHAYQKGDLVDGIQYYVLGATGGFLHKSKVGGGFHHLTLLSVEGDRFTVSLLEVGTVLPDDFVLSSDYREFSRLDPLFNRDTGVIGMVPNPEMGEVNGEVPVRLVNPLSVPVPVSLRLAEGSGSWSAEPEVKEVELAARGTVTETVHLRSAEIPPEHFVVPEVLITYLYEDSRGRTVPVEVRSRVPVLRRAVVQSVEGAITLDGEDKEAAWESATPLPLEFWTYSMYRADVDPAPTVRLLYDGDALFLSASVQDRIPAIFPGGPGSRVLSDSFELSAKTLVGETRDFLFQVLDDDPEAVYTRADSGGGWQEADIHGITFAALRSDEGYRLEARIDPEVLLGTSDPAGEEFRFNLSLYDNDANPYPMVRRWAAGEPEHWGTLVFEEEER